MREITVAVIGGDKRFVSVAEAFLKRDNISALLCGFERLQPVIPCVSPYDAARGADVLVLPIPCSVDGVNVNAPFAEREIPLERVFRSMSGNTLILGGRVDEALYKLAANHGFEIIDYLCREELAVLNSVPTAEGAIEIAMRELSTTLWGQNVLIAGFGRIGKTLAADLKALGCEVTVCARRQSDLAWCSVDGYKTTSFDRLKNDLCKYSVIFNTVPSLIFDAATLACTAEDVLLIDLASSPGGVDFESAKRLARRTVWALSLPGKVAPITAGQIIERTVASVLREKSLITE